MKKQKNYYPLGLWIFGIIFVGCLAYMLKIAFQAPVQMDDAYMMTYRDVDKNYNDIVAAEKKFDSMYDVNLTKSTLVKGSSNIVSLEIKDKKGQPVDANITCIVTRPDTNVHNIKLAEFVKDEKGVFSSKPFALELYGRWKSMYKINIGDTQKFISVETFIDPKK